MPKVSIDKSTYIGKTYGRWSIVSVIFKGRRTYVSAVCSCGVKRDVRLDQIINGSSQSCGCFKMDRIKRVAKTHGFSKTATYTSWLEMKGRCYCPTKTQYSDYGGRGITVCERWLGENGFVNFLDDMGERPSVSHTLDRKDNNGQYCKDNCKWATRAEQQRNRRNNILVTYRGETKCLTDWCSDLGLNKSTIAHRLKSGMSAEKCFTIPISIRGPQLRNRV